MIIFYTSVYYNNIGSLEFDQKLTNIEIFLTDIKPGKLSLGTHWYAASIGSL